MLKTIFDKRGLLFISYCVVVIFVSLFHEWWRDEWNAVNLVIYTTDFSELIHLIRLEGHPPLWYFLIKLCWNIFPDNLSVIILHLSIIVATVWLLIYKVKWPFVLKALLVFSYFFIFEYAIPVRNYSLVLLFAVWLIVLWQQKSHFTWMLLPAIGLFYSNIYGILFFAGWSLFILLETWGNRSRILEFLGFAIGGILSALLYYWIFSPLGNKSVAQADLDLFRAVKVLPKGLAYFWNAFVPFPLLKVDFWNTNLLDSLGEYASLKTEIDQVVITYLIKTVFVLPLIYFLLKPLLGKKKILAVLLLSWFLVYLLQIYLYEGYLRHWGYYFVFYIFWVIVAEVNVRILKYILAISCISGIVALFIEIKYPFSNAEAIVCDINKTGNSDFPVIITSYSEIPSFTGFLGNGIYYPNETDKLIQVNWRIDEIIEDPAVVELFFLQKKLLNNNMPLYLIVPTSRSKLFSEFLAEKYQIGIKTYPASITSENFVLIEIFDSI